MAGRISSLRGAGAFLILALLTSCSERRPVVARDAIPPMVLDAVVRAHYRGLGHMERYEYGKAAAAFREARGLAPGWIPGSVNLAIALLNKTGNQEESTKAGGRRAAPGGPPIKSNFEEALELLDEVLRREPGNLHARYSRGVILEYLGQIREANQAYRFVAEHDPSDAHAWYKVGSTLPDTDDPDRPAGPRQAAELIAIYSKAVERNPYLVSALYKLQQSYSWAGDRAKQKEVLTLWQRLDPKTRAAAPGDTAETFYGEMGRYASIVNPFAAATGAGAARPTAPPPPRFDPLKPISVDLPKNHRWVRSSDFQGEQGVLVRVRDRFGAPVATLDVDGDGRLDLYLAAAVRGPGGIRDALLINRGDGTFEDRSTAYGLPDGEASVGVAAGDFDADRRIDLFLTGIGKSRLLRNRGGRFEDVTHRAGIKPGALSLTARWLDLDQDGDLDLYVINATTADRARDAFGAKPVPGLTNIAYRNDGRPEPIAGRAQDNWAPLAVSTADLSAKSGLSIAFTPWPDAEALGGGEGPHTAVAALDVDNDRDLDLILAADGEPPRIILNDRLGRFHRGPDVGLAASSPGNSSTGVPNPGPVSGGGLLVTDLDKDGRTDLIEIAPSGPVRAWRNTSDRRADAGPIAWETWPANALDWRMAVAADLDLDTWPDLVGLPGGDRDRYLSWARNEATRLRDQPLAVGSSEAPGPRSVGFHCADLIGDPLPDLLVLFDGEAPRLARSLGNGQHWLALDLSGRWKIFPDHMRSNPHGSGTRVAAEGEGLLSLADHTTQATGLGQSVGPLVLGLGKSVTAPLVRLRWPDGTMQCELNVNADRLLTLAEHNRKTGSCPVLFTWNGDRFTCLGDFLGGGGLGYLVAPGVAGQPDRDEAVAIAGGDLKPERGAYRLVVTEPMDEVAYLDKLMLEVVDRPPGVESTPDERFAPEGTPPTGVNVAWRQAIEPVRATDFKGRDVLDVLRNRDRRTVDGFRRRVGWIGYAEDHGIVLDFGDRLRGFGSAVPLTLCLAGWVEYPYSQTNYAAATAGVVLRPPLIERRKADGTWEVIEPHAGYPAGLPRMTTLDLSGKLGGDSCVIRVRTTMECYWDQAFVAVRDPGIGLRTTSLPVQGAVLGDHGYSRETSPDGRPPLLYDYEQVDPAPLARMAGRLTRYGDVAPLLREDDDRLCLVGPGDEVRLEFDAAKVPPLPDGWSRGFVLRAVGYCKDADPFTMKGDTIGPLPWRGMPAYPFGPDGERPLDPAYRDYLRDYQTRAVGDR